MNKKYFLGAILFQILVLVGCGDAKPPAGQNGSRLPLTEGPAEPSAPPIDPPVPPTPPHVPGNDSSSGIATTSELTSTSSSAFSSGSIDTSGAVDASSSIKTGMDRASFVAMDIPPLNRELSGYSAISDLPEALRKQVEYWTSEERGAEQQVLAISIVELLNIDGTRHPAGKLYLLEKTLTENPKLQRVARVIS